MKKLLLLLALLPLFSSAQIAVSREDTTLIVNIGNQPVEFKSKDWTRNLIRSIVSANIMGVQWPDVTTLTAASKIVQRDGYGSILLPRAVEQEHAVPLFQLDSALLTKVDKVEGKSLSTNDFSDAYRDKLDNVEDPLFLGSYGDLAALEAAHPTGISGQYAYVQGVEEGNDVVFTYQWVVLNNDWEILRGASNAETPLTVKQKYESNANTNSFTDAEKAKLAGIQAGAQVNVPLEYAVPTLDQVVKRANHTQTNLFRNIAGGGRVGLEDVDGIGVSFTSDRDGNSGFQYFDGTLWRVATNTIATNKAVMRFDGRVKGVDPTESNDFVTLNYFNTGLATKSNLPSENNSVISRTNTGSITSLLHTPSVTPNTLVSRNGESTFSASDPTQAQHVVTLNYLNSRIPNISFLYTRTVARTIPAGISALGCNYMAYDFGGGYSNTGDRSTFTAPIAGIYRFDASAYLGAVSATSVWVGIYVVSSRSTTQNGEYKFNNTAAGTGKVWTVTGGMDIRLNAGDTVQARVYSNISVNIMSATATWFSGRLITPL